MNGNRKQNNNTKTTNVSNESENSSAKALNFEWKTNSYLVF